jgi:adenylate kinase family enzyme
MQRVMVVGNGGSGKSTFATTLGNIAELPVVHLDREFWGEGWVPSAPDRWRAHCAVLVLADRWIMDGNYSSTYAERIPRADLIVFLDLPRWITMPSAIRRWLRWRGSSRPSMAAGCPEQLSTEFLLWMWRYPQRGRRAVLQAVKDAGANDRLVRLRSRRAAARWLETLPVGGAGR